MQSRINELKKLGIPTEFHAYGGVERGVGLGTGTAAYGWLNRAVAFWEKNVTIHGQCHLVKLMVRFQYVGLT